MAMAKIYNNYNRRQKVKEAGIATQTYAENMLNIAVEEVAEKLNKKLPLTVEEIKNMMELKDNTIDLTEIEDVLRINAIVGFVCGSDVGKNTKAVIIPKSIGIPLDLPKVFKHVKVSNKGSKIRYVNEDGESQVFVEGVNIYKAVTKMGQANTIYKVSYHELNKFIEILSKIDVDALTEEDLAMIRRDIDIIGRALQEIAIDSAKDKNKAKGWTNIDEIINMKIKMVTDLALTHNFNNISKAKYKQEIGEAQDIAEFKMIHDGTLPTNWYTEEEFESLSLEEQEKAEDSELVVGLLGLAQKSILEGTNEEMANLVKVYKFSNPNSFDEYSVIGNNAKQVTTMLTKVIGVIAHSYRCNIRLEDDVILSLRNALYNEVRTNEIFERLHPTKLGKCAIAAGMATIKKDKSGAINLSYNKSALKFGTVSRLFRNEFVAEYRSGANMPSGTIKVTNTNLPGFSVEDENVAHVSMNGNVFLLCKEYCAIEVTLRPKKFNANSLVEGYVYKFENGNAVMVSDGKSFEPVIDELTVKESFTGYAIIKDGKIVAAHNVNAVKDKNIGCLIVKDWLDTDCLINGSNITELEVTKLTDSTVLDIHEDLLYNADRILVTGVNNNLIVAQHEDVLRPICRVEYAPGLAEKGAEIKVENVFSFITLADKENIHSKSEVSGMFTYTVK